ncbi:hypothetical protein GCM10028808_73250 [Spirosoma migulaei]
MSIVTADITGGAYASSVLVNVAADVDNGTTIVVCRGEFVVGSGLVTDGTANVVVTPLASGDIIQASVTERGNQAGIPVRVDVNPLSATGWVKPDMLETTLEDGTVLNVPADAYAESFGEVAGAIYDPVTAGATLLPADYDKEPLIELGFDLETTQQAGTTTIRVVPRGNEGLLVGWNGASPTSPAALVLTTSATITVAVERDDNPGIILNRSLSVIVLPEPTYPSAPAAGDIKSSCWRNYGNGFIRAMINCLKPCEAQLVGYSSTWIPAITRETNFQEADWSGPVPAGTYTCNIRVVGEEDSANYYTYLITVL